MRKGNRLLAFVLMVIILSSYLPIEVFAEKPLFQENLLQGGERFPDVENDDSDLELVELKSQGEEYDSYNLEELKFFIDDEEVNLKDNFFQDNYSYELNLPRETKEVKIKAVPVTKTSQVKIYDGNRNNYYISSEDDYTIKIPFNPNENIENYDSGFERSLRIQVIPQNPPTVSWEPKYSIKTIIAGYPKPVIKGTKNFLFQQHEEVTKEDLLQGIQAIDEIDGDITERIEVIPMHGLSWYKGMLDTRFLVDDSEIWIRVQNSHNQTTQVYCKVKIIKEKPEQTDNILPIISGVESKTFYIGDKVDKEKLLEGIVAIDDVDGDITDKIEVTPESLNTDEIGKYHVRYSVEDKAGNKAEKVVWHRIIEKPVDQSDKEERIREIVASNIPNYYGTGEEWKAIDLAICGKSNLIHKQTLLTRAQQVIKASPKKVTEYERIIISLTAAGLDARNIPLGDGSNVNLIRKISNYEDMSTLNDYIWALIAYDSGNYSVPKDSKWTRQSLINYILEHQLADGSWSLDNKLGSQLDVDITAMTISALAPYKADLKVEKALEEAINSLARVKTKDYCFIYGPQNVETSESGSMVLIALASMGIDPNTDQRFSSDTKSVIDGQLSFVTEKNFFKHAKVFVDGYIPGPDAMATEQGLRAFLGYLKSQENDYKPYHIYQFSNYGGDDDPSVEIPEDIITLRELNILQTPYKTKYNIGDKTNLDGLKVEALYSNGNREIISNDKLHFYDFNTNTSGYKNVLVKFGGLSTTFEITIEDLELENDEFAQISVIDPKGKTYFASKSLSIQEGKDTAFSLLQKTGLDYEYNDRGMYDGVYVFSIEGLAEFDGGPDSGWMYSVNGNFPSFSSSLYKLKKNDRVEWFYTRDLGKDLGHDFDDSGSSGDSNNSKDEKPDEKPIEPPIIEPEPIEPPIIEPIDPSNFTDIKDHWAKEVIEYTTNKGYFKGTDENSFSPDRSMTRAEFITVLGRRSNVDIEAYSGQRLKDIKANDYYTGYANWALEKGIVKGYVDGSFKPNKGISREEMAVVLNRYMKIGNKNKDRNEKINFIDESQISSWAKEAVNSLVKEGIIKGRENNKFVPKANLTRAEVAQIFYNIDMK